MKRQVARERAKEMKKATSKVRSSGSLDISQGSIMQSIVETTVQKIETVFYKAANRGRPPPSSSAAKNDYHANYNRQKQNKGGVREVPWLENSSASASTLSEELESFYDYVQLTDVEHQSRYNFVEDLKSIVRIKWPTYSLYVYGSYCVGLSIFLSDIDMIISPNNSKDCNSLEDSEDDSEVDDNKSGSSSSSFEKSASNRCDDSSAIDISFSIDRGVNRRPTASVGLSSEKDDYIKSNSDLNFEKGLKKGSLMIHEDTQNVS